MRDALLSSSPPAERVRPAAAAALAAVVFLACWGLLHVGFWRHGQVVDTPVYQRYGEAIERGEVPYRDFTPEYPPLALPVFALPALVSSGDAGYRNAFEALMAACGVALVGLVALTARSLRLDAARTLLLVAVFPLLLGTVVLTRFDLWPAALAAGALAALVAGRDRLGAVVLALATAAKIYPGALLPLAVAWAWRRKGAREGVIVLDIWFACLLAIYAPFVLLGEQGVADSISRQLSRPLQIESLGAALLLAGHQLFGLGIGMKSGSGSQNLAGALPDALAIALSVVQAVTLVALWVAFARGPMTPERLARYAAAVVVAFVALGKVLSPQFLIWLVPVVALVRGRAAAVLAAALVVTQLWFPFRYWDLVREFDPLVSWLVLARDLLLVALLVVLVRPSRRFLPFSGLRAAGS